MIAIDLICTLTEVWGFAQDGSENISSAFCRIDGTDEEISVDLLSPLSVRPFDIITAAYVMLEEMGLKDARVMRVKYTVYWEPSIEYIATSKETRHYEI